MSVAPMLTRAVASLLLLTAVNAFAAAGLVQFAAGDVKIRNGAGETAHGRERRRGGRGRHASLTAAAHRRKSR